MALQNTSQSNILQLLLNVSQYIAAGSSLDHIIPVVLEGLSSTTEAVAARLVLVRPAKTIVFATGLDIDGLSEIDIPIHLHVQKHGSSTLQDLSVLGDDLPLSKVQDHFSSIMVFPLDVQDESQQATVWLAFKGDATLKESDYDVVNLLAMHSVIALNNDYTVERAEIEREQRMALIKNDIEPIIYVDTNHQIQVFNLAAQTLFGIEENEALGNPYNAVIESKVLQELLAAGLEAAKDVEFSAENGMTFSPNLVPVYSESGELRGWMMILRDVTRFKNLSENMSTFLHTVSHDIRSPMTAAKGYVDMLRMVGPVNERQQTFIEKILTSIHDMTNLVEKVLDAGRLDPEMDAYEIRRETTDPSSIIQKVVSTLATAADSKKISLTSNVSPNVPIMFIDELMTERAMMNLAENAIKYSPEGGEVHIGAKIEDEMLVLSVSDNGYGISEEDQERLFERGERVRRKEHKGIRGSGLGLFIVRNVARKHKGFATVDSEVGKGSVFTISIPLIPANLVGGGGHSGE